MTRKKSLPCPICGRKPDITPGLKTVIIGRDHWVERKCPFKKMYEVDLLDDHYNDWNRCVQSFEEFRTLYANQECPVCGKTATVEVGFDHKSNTLHVVVACGCTKAEADCLSRAVNLWLDKHQSAAKKRITANRQAEDIARVLPGTIVDRCEVGDPIDWTVHCLLGTFRKNPDFDAFPAATGLKMVEENGHHRCTLTIRAHDAREAGFIAGYESPQAKAAEPLGIHLFDDRITRA